MEKISRRQALQMTVAGAAGVTIGGCATVSSSGGNTGAEQEKKSVLTVAHLTDVHVKPEGKAAMGMRQALRAVHALPNRPDVIFNGGDAIMDSLAASKERTEEQWALWKQILKEENTIPIEHCIGNHDIWGWQKSKAGTTGSEPLYGLKMAMEQLGLEKPYRTFDRAGWKFIVLNSMQERGDEGYLPALDDEQFDWLSGELDASPKETPICILSHIPIISVTPFFFVKNIVKDHNFNLIGALAHQDVQRIRDLFAKHSNIRLCLSGHDHLTDRVEYNGITYICNGSVCGNWWKGRFVDCDPGFAIVRFYADGTFDNHYQTYDWDPSA
ncbi:metallophosphoesterase [Candidatus Sumerlaeota bacterium]|nr:metallophosphoesterase [Candidatus Sumerlaeota bacterium]